MILDFRVSYRFRDDTIRAISNRNTFIEIIDRLSIEFSIRWYSIILDIIIDQYISIIYRNVSKIIKISIHFDILSKYIDQFGCIGTHIDRAQEFDKNFKHCDTIIETYRSNLGVWVPNIDKSIVSIDTISI